MTERDDSDATPWLLVSDIDDTLTGDAEALERLSNALEVADNTLIFCTNSSRPAESVAETLAGVFPQKLVPAAVITALGTEITIAGNVLPDWEARFAGWPSQAVFEILAGLGHDPHDSQFQTGHKVSFAVAGDEAQAEARHALTTAGIDCEIIASGFDDFDVIPKGAGKAAATLFLAQTLEVENDRLVVAGDSGNDLSMFQVARHRIAVGNARKELIDALEPETFYHAQAAHAAGVHEGLIHFGALPDDAEQR